MRQWAIIQLCKFRCVDDQYNWVFSGAHGPNSDHDKCSSGAYCYGECCG
jgi:hypothetical protein